MKKFYTLVKKEVKELLTLQMLMPLIAVVLVFLFTGKVVGKQVEQSAQKRIPVAVLDLDNTETSRNATQALQNSGFDVAVYENSRAEDAVSTAKRDNKNFLLILPKGFEENIRARKSTVLPTYTIMENFSFLGSRNSHSPNAVLAAINDSLSKSQISALSPGVDASSIRQPVRAEYSVVVGDKQARVNPAAINGFISSQSTFIPIVLFLVIVFASQLIASSIATEKENKTLETLLSSPVSRRAIVAAKLVGAGLVALLTSAIYLFGIRNYLNGFAGAGAVDASTKQAAEQLGLVFNAGDYATLGIALFFGILAALSIALILGSFAQDAKSAQGIVAPLMMMVLLPYFLVLFLDLRTISPAIKYFVYAIPFSHTFLAAPNLMLDQYKNVWFGIGYLAAFFLVFVFIAAKIFNSDKILTLHLRLKTKKRA